MAEADIVDRLRDGSVGTWNGLEIVDRRPSIQDIREAADTIERLTSQLAVVRAKAIEDCIAIADAELQDPKNSGRGIAKLLRALNGSAK